MADTEITVGADTSAFEASMKRITDVAGKAESSISSMFSEFGAQAIAAAASVGALTKAIHESLQAQREVKQLELAMAGVGHYTKAASEGMQDFADSLAAQIGGDAGAITSQLALSKTFGATNEQAKQLVETAYDLAAVTGKDVNSTIEQLGATFDGQAGKLKKYVVGIEKLTEEQLKAGAAIKLARGQFEGAFEAIANPLEIATGRLQEDVKTFFEKLGNYITKDPFWVNVINLIKNIFDSLQPILQAAFEVFTEMFKSLIRTLSGFILAFTGPLEALGNYLGKDFGLGKLNDSLMATADIYKTVVPKTKDFSEVINKLNDNAKNGTKDFGKYNKEFEDFVKTIEMGMGGDIEKFAAQQTETFRKLESFRTKISKDRLQTLNDLEQKLAIDTAKKLQDLYDKQAKEEAAKKKEQEDKILEMKKRAATDYASYILNLSKTKDIERSTQMATAAVLGAATDVLSSSKGRDSMKKVLSNVFNAVSPEYGPLISALMNFLDMDREQVTRFVDEFVAAIPDIIEKTSVNGVAAGIRILQSMLTTKWLNAWISAWKAASFETVKYNIDAFANFWSNEAVPALTYAIQKIFLGMGTYFNSKALGFDQLKTDLQTIFSDGFEKFGTQKIIDSQNTLTTALNDLKEEIKKAFTPPGAGTQGGIFGDFNAPGKLNQLPFQSPYFDQSQTSVPNVNFGPNNPMGDIPGYGLSGTDQPMIIKSEVKLNQTAFAEIILQLSRQNMRMA